MTDDSVMIAELRDQLRTAIAVRDDARVASARDLEQRRCALALLALQEKRIQKFANLLSGVSDDDLDKAIQVTDMHAAEYGELEQALTILRLLKRARWEMDND